MTLPTGETDTVDVDVELDDLTNFGTQYEYLVDLFRDRVADHLASHREDYDDDDHTRLLVTGYEAVAVPIIDTIRFSVSYIVEEA